ncbi:hypothetical protein BC828DRAFT_381030 [Blastocladiella britannica]|nr:hypothetical protein BC828DRAFT_381030 [Blastocladiella britannica]
MILTSLISVLILFGAVVLEVARAQGGATIEIAEIYPFSTANDDLSNSLVAVHDAHLLAIRHAQEDGFLPAVNVRLRQYDTSGTSAVADEQMSVFSAADADKHNVAGILGPASSMQVKLVSLVTQPFQLPICSAYAASSSLSNKEQFPHVYRFMYTSIIGAQATQGFLAYYNWNRYTLVYESDSGFALEFATALETFAASAGQTILASLVLFSPTVQPQCMQLIFKSLIATDTNILVLITVTERGQNLLQDLHQRKWFSDAAPGRPRVLITMNSPIIDLYMSSPEQANEILALASVFDTGSAVGDDSIMQEFLDDYQRDHGAIYPPHAIGTDANFMFGYACAYTMIVGLHRLAQLSPSSSYAALAAHDPAVWSHMSLQLFNVTESVIPRPRRLFTTDANGDGYIQTTAFGQFNAALPNATSLNGTICNVYPISERPKNTDILAPCLFPGLPVGQIPSDRSPAPIIVQINPQLSDSTGTSMVIIASLSSVLILGSGSAFFYFRAHAGIKQTQWPVNLALHGTGLLFNVQVLLEVGIPTPLGCMAQSIVWSAAVGIAYILFYVQAKIVARAINSQHRIGSPLVHKPSSASAFSAVSKHGTQLTSKVRNRTISWAVRPRNRSSQSQVSTEPPRTREQEFLDNFSLVDGTRGVAPAVKTMMQYAATPIFAYILAIAASIYMCQPTTKVEMLGKDMAQTVCSCKSFSINLCQSGVYLMNASMILATGQLVIKHRKVQFNSRVMARIGAAMLNLSVILTVLFGFGVAPATRWLYSFFAVLRVYSVLSTIAIFTLPLCVRMYSISKQGGSVSTMPTAGSTDSLTECVMQLRSGRAPGSASSAATASPTAAAAKTATEKPTDLTKAAFTATGDGSAIRKEPGILATRFDVAVSPSPAASPLFVFGTVSHTPIAEESDVPTELPEAHTVPAGGSEQQHGGHANPGSAGSGGSVRYFVASVSKTLPRPEQLHLSPHDPLWATYKAYVRAHQQGGGASLRRRHGPQLQPPPEGHAWSSLGILTVGGCLEDDVRIVLCSGSPEDDMKRVAGPARSFDMISVAKQDRSQQELLQDQRHHRVSLLYCRTREEFCVLRFGTQAEYREFCTIVRPRPMHDINLMMSVI